jgi:60 kDa SS-A/Ro ribonucleoprotein
MLTLKHLKWNLVSILLTSFATDQFYRTANDTFEQLKTLIGKCNKKFVAQAIVFARTEYGMRSISHVAASELAKHVSGEEWARKFYSAVIYRPDDMMEILSYHKEKNGKVPNAMKKGIASAFDKFNAYQLAKYRGEGKGFKLVDVVNMVHPTPVEANKEAIAALVKGELKSFDTWESELTKAGQTATTDDEKSSFKKEVWVKLIKEKKIGYLALLRNLRNIVEQAPSVLDDALASLTNTEFIKKSLIFPFQYLVAYKQFVQSNTKEARKVAEALSRAVDISCENVKTLGLEGETLVAVDNSGSMDSPVTKSEHMNRSELGALFGIVLAKAINADIMEFGDFARYINYSLLAHSMDFAASFSNLNAVGHGTNFPSIFDKANKKYDRVIILSDMQGWDWWIYSKGCLR